MCNLVFESQGVDFGTPVPNDFFANYLPKAAGLHVKVYLYLYYHFYHATPGFSFAAAAEALGLTEADITEALQYWHGTGLITVTRTASCYRVKFHTRARKNGADPDPSGKPSKDESEQSASRVVRVEQKPVYDPQEINEVRENPGVKALFAKAERFFGGNVSFNTYSTLYSFLEYYRLPLEVVDYLLDYCAAKEKRNLRYMEKIAMSWSDEGVHSVEDAKALADAYDSRYQPVMEALGLSRRPYDEERSFIDKWLDEYRFTNDIIAEAASRTLKRTGGAKFGYMNTILQSWYENNYSTLDEILNGDVMTPGKPSVSKAGSSTFHTYIPSDTDYNAAAAAEQEKYYSELFADKA